MVSVKHLLKRLDALQKLAEGGASGKLRRFLHAPGRYISTMLFLKYQYPKTKRGILKKAGTFFGAEMTLLLPAATDIYLTGGKTHHSETSLARYIIMNLKEGQTFVDVGAHFGYFALLAAIAVKNSGSVICFEASANTYSVLEENVSTQQNIKAVHMAVSDKEETIQFYEFPILYSEYNSMSVDQFKDENWYSQNKPVQIEVTATTLDAYIRRHSLVPDMIKIDVEGVEDKAIAGCTETLKTYHPSVILEFLSKERGNEPHHRAWALLKSFGYSPYVVNRDGSLEGLEDIDQHLEDHQLDSENVVFIKKQN